jgi:hypothetical protein
LEPSMKMVIFLPSGPQRMLMLWVRATFPAQTYEYHNRPVTHGQPKQAVPRHPRLKWPKPNPLTSSSPPNIPFMFHFSATGPTISLSTKQETLVSSYLSLTTLP